MLVFEITDAHSTRNDFVEFEEQGAENSWSLLQFLNTYYFNNYW